MRSKPQLPPEYLPRVQQQPQMESDDESVEDYSNVIVINSPKPIPVKLDRLEAHIKQLREQADGFIPEYKVHTILRRKKTSALDLHKVEKK